MTLPVNADIEYEGGGGGVAGLERSRKAIRPTLSVTMVGPNFRVGKKIGAGNFGFIHIGAFRCSLFFACCISVS